MPESPPHPERMPELQPFPVTITDRAYSTRRHLLRADGISNLERDLLLGNVAEVLRLVQTPDDHLAIPPTEDHEALVARSSRCQAANIWVLAVSRSSRLEGLIRIRMPRRSRFPASTPQPASLDVHLTLAAWVA